MRVRATPHVVAIIVEIGGLQMSSGKSFSSTAAVGLACLLAASACKDFSNGPSDGAALDGPRDSGPKDGVTGGRSGGGNGAGGAGGGGGGIQVDGGAEDLPSDLAPSDDGPPAACAAGTKQC